MTLTQASQETSFKSRPLEPAGTPFRRFRGSAHPFGSTPTSEGTNFSLFSANATAVQLLIFTNPSDKQPVKVVDLDPGDNRSFNIWHAYIEGVKPGMGYAYRVDGPREP